MKARDYLVSKGLARQGRGKFSNEAKNALIDAVASGSTFDDWPKSDIVPAKVSKPKKVDDFPDYVCPSDFRYPETEYKAVNIATGEIYTMRSACNNCGISLVMCYCGQPRVYGNLVKIEGR